MHFAAQEIDVRHVRRNVRRGLPHAEADFQHRWRFPPEGSRKIQRRLLKGQQELPAQFCVGLGLAGGDAARAAHEAAHPARMRHVGFLFGGRWLVLGHGDGAEMRLTGKGAILQSPASVKPDSH